MNKNKGFTLVELMGIVLILSVASLITFYSVSKMINNSAQENYEKFLRDIYIAAENYIELNRDDFRELDHVGGTVFIGIQDLIDKEFVSKVIKNPKTEEFEENATVIAKTNNNYIVEYEYTNKNLSLNGYKQDALILHYDGYSKPKDKLWTDFSYGENNAVVDNAGYTWDLNRINSTTATKAILTSNKVTLTEQMTFSILFEITAGSDPQPLFSARTGFNSDLMIFYYLGNTITIDAGTRLTAYSSFVRNKIYKLDVVIDKNVVKTYLDGNIASTLTSTRLLTAMQSNLKLGIFGETTKQGASNYYTSGNLYNVKVYSRILTDAEIISNYELDKARFNI